MENTLKVNKKNDNTSKTVILLGASFETNNLGVSALVCGAVSSICNSFPEAKILLLDYGIKKSTKKVVINCGIKEVEKVNIRFSKKIYHYNNIAFLILLAITYKLIPYFFLKNKIIKTNKIISTIVNANIIGSIAGGDSFSDIYGFERLIYTSLPQILVLLLGKKLVLLPQTYGPFKSLLSKIIARYIIRRSAKIYSRDFEGIRRVRELIKNNHKGISFCYDLGFVMEPKIEAIRIPHWLNNRLNKFTIIGLNISGLLYIGGYQKNNMFGLNVNYRELINNIIQYFIDNRDTRIALVPHVFGGNKIIESDFAASKEIYCSIKSIFKDKIFLVEEKYDQHEIKAIIGNCKFFVGSRMHSCIAALSQYIPAIGLAYSYKFMGVYKSIGIEDLVIDLCETNEKTALLKLDKLYKTKDKISNRLKENIPGAKRSVMSLFESLL
jgi:polysaccharide pyruvyl transferase WcaK-like protein